MALSQLVALDQDSQDLGTSPPPGRQATQAAQDLPHTPAPGEPPVKPPPLATTQQLQLMLTDTSAASNPTRAERHLRPAKRTPPPPPLLGTALRCSVADAGHEQAEVAPAVGFPQPRAAITDAIAEPEPYGTDSEQGDMADGLEGLHGGEHVHAWLFIGAKVPPEPRAN